MVLTELVLTVSDPDIRQSLHPVAASSATLSSMPPRWTLSNALDVIRITGGCLGRREAAAVCEHILVRIVVLVLLSSRHASSG